MSQRIESYSGLKAVALEIAYDNGMINRMESEKDFLRSTDEVIGAEGVYDADLRKMDEFCSFLSKEEQNTLAAGETEEVKDLILRFDVLHPGLGKKLDGLLNDIFDREPEGYKPEWV